MNDGLSRLEARLLDGQEPFHGPGVTQPLLLIDYWRWQGSALLDNTSRGILAEFLVASALGLHRKPRREWDESDIRMASGTTIEVKSSAYVQSWEQCKPSVIEFGIAPHRSWNAETGEYREGFKRWANVYVFCVFTGKEPLEPLDTSKWDFYVLPTEVLDREVPEQKNIRLNPLKKLKPYECQYPDLKETIENIGHSIREEP
ncbi:MAG: hypothetical protein OXG10_01070 [Candidatus Dadabacteria bacterium]|nr:hypothetical protein [Candidatus Dadabacteria bacterium]